jgi:hypothetical protein
MDKNKIIWPPTLITFFSNLFLANVWSVVRLDNGSLLLIRHIGVLREWGCRSDIFAKNPLEEGDSYAFRTKSQGEEVNYFVLYWIFVKNCRKRGGGPRLVLSKAWNLNLPAGTVLMTTGFPFLRENLSFATMSARVKPATRWLWISRTTSFSQNTSPEKETWFFFFVMQNWFRRL